MPRAVSLWLLCSLCALTYVPLARAAAADIYLSQGGAGNGTSCSAAKDVAFFNSAASWGPGANKIGPNTTVHLCGTFTGDLNASALTFHASGTAGTPITLVFEPFAVLTSPAWSPTGAIVCSDQSFIVIDGGTNGLITNTDNGSAFANQVDSTAVECRASPNVEIKNLTVTNMYVHQGGSPDENRFGTGIDISGSDHSRVYRNTIHDAAIGIHYNYIAAGNVDVDIHDNTVWNCNWNIGGGDENAQSTVSNLNVHDNDLHDMANWDDQGANLLQHADIYFSAMKGGTIANESIYNNFMHGDPGQFSTASFFFQGKGLNINVFNNVIAPAPQPNATGLIDIDGKSASVTTVLVANNTLVGPTNAAGDGIDLGTGVSLVTIENNIFKMLGSAIDSPESSTTLTASDHNLFFDVAGPVSMVSYKGLDYLTLAAWQTATGFDPQSIGADPSLGPDYKPLAGSPAIDAGVNLTGLGIAALNADKAGVARGAGWDMGAFQFDPAAPQLDGGVGRDASVGTHTSDEAGVTGQGPRAQSGCSCSAGTPADDGTRAAPLGLGVVAFWVARRRTLRPPLRASAATRPA